MKLISLILAMMLMAGCNTVQGLGKDLKKGGEELEKAASK